MYFDSTDGISMQIVGGLFGHQPILQIKAVSDPYLQLEINYTRAIK